MYTPQWNSQMNDGTIIAWPSAVWGAGVLAGVAPSSKGKWKMAPLPQWSADERSPASGAAPPPPSPPTSKQQAQAAKFAKWLNTDPEALKVLVEIGLYPAATAGQTSGGLGAAPEYMTRARPTTTSRPRRSRRPRAASAAGARTPTSPTAPCEDLMPTAVKKKADFAAVATRCRQMSLADLKKQGSRSPAAETPLERSSSQNGYDHDCQQGRPGRRGTASAPYLMRRPP